MLLTPGKKIFFASDFHLGLPDYEGSKARERHICAWLDEIAPQAAGLFLVGDLFDTWFEYREVVPKGYTRFLGTIARMADSGIPIEVFTGNHDLWMRGYFEQEMGIPVHHNPIDRTIAGKRFCIAHGDGLGPGDHGYKMLKKILRNPVSQWLYRRLHPDTGVAFASRASRLGPKHDAPEEVFLGQDKEWLVQYCLEVLATTHYDYFIFGHRHLALEYPLPGNSLYVNLGDWLSFYSYAEFDGADLKLRYYPRVSASSHTS